MKDEGAREMTDTELLEFTSLIAAPVRRMAVKYVDGKAVPRAPRKLITYKRETGETTGYTTNVKFVEGLVKRQALEIAVEEGVRPKEVFCERCGKIVKVKSKVGNTPRFCGKSCNKDHVVEWRAKNVEKWKARKSKYHAEYRAKNPEKVKASDAKWRAKNAEKMKASMKKYQAKNAEKVKAYKTVYYAENRERINAERRAKSAAKKYAAE